MLVSNSHSYVGILTRQGDGLRRWDLEEARNHEFDHMNGVVVVAV